MLPKRRRVSKEFFNNSAKTISFSGEILSVRIQKSEGLSRATFVVSKKVARSAVARNRLRRVGYAAIEKLISKINPGKIFIFYFKKVNPKISVFELSEEIKKLLKASEKVIN